MKQVKIRDIVIGEGIPKICVPINGNTDDEILAETSKVLKKNPDIIEWRADCYDYFFEQDKMLSMLTELRRLSGNTPILYTVRTSNEGGTKDIDIIQYEKATALAVESGYIDLLDIEAFFNMELTIRMVEKCKKTNVGLILSNHRFHMTADKQELIAIMNKMQSYAPDIVKLAVMPKNIADVITLISASEEMNRMHADIPIITISMSKEGCISRFTGELFGSAVTFASAVNSSAPGQADIEDTRMVLNIINKYLKGMVIQ